MKKNIKIRYVVLAILGLLIIGLNPHNIALGGKYKAKLSVKYHKLMGSDAFLLINAKYKGENGYEPASDLKLYVYRGINEDSVAFKGEIVTNSEGNARFMLADVVDTGDIAPRKYFIEIENNKKFKDLSKTVKFLDSNIFAEIKIKDSIPAVYARLTDIKGNPVEGQKLEIRVRRLFAPLNIGKSYYKTDANGTVLVPIDDPLPGINGNLTFEVVLDNRKYGEVKYVFNAPVGKQIKELSTFDQRTMWSPPGKTPVFLLIFPNLLILGVWIIIALLIRNLFKIYKS